MFNFNEIMSIVYNTLYVVKSKANIYFYSAGKIYAHISNGALHYGSNSYKLTTSNLHRVLTDIYSNTQTKIEVWA